LNTEPVNTAVAGDLSVSAQISAFALLIAGEPNSQYLFLNLLGAFARLMLRARSVCHAISESGDKT